MPALGFESAPLRYSALRSSVSLILEYKAQVQSTGAKYKVQSTKYKYKYNWAFDPHPCFARVAPCAMPVYSDDKWKRVAEHVRGPHAQGGGGVALGTGANPKPKPKPKLESELPPLDLRWQDYELDRLVYENGQAYHRGGKSPPHTNRLDPAAKTGGQEGCRFAEPTKNVEDE